MKLPEGYTKGTFEQNCTNGFFPTECYLVGAIAIHFGTFPGGFRWKLSHAATGLGIPYAYGRTLAEACEVARALNAAIQWHKIKRHKNGKARGVTRKVSDAIRALTKQFPFLAAGV